MHPIGVASAAWVFAASVSRTPFYVAGVVLAGWAVLLAAFGATRPDFPGSRRRASLVMLGSFVLVVVTMTAAVVTAGEGGGARARAPQRPASFGAASTLELTADPAGQLAYDRKQATVATGRVAIHFVNTSPLAHNVTIAVGGRVVASTKTIQGGAVTATTSLKPGDYAFYCSVDAHRAAGMEGKLTVTP